MNSVYPWTIALVSTEPSSRELMEYAIRAMFPKTIFCSSTCPRWWLENIKAQSPSAFVTSHKLYADLDGLCFSTRLKNAGFSGPIMMLSNSDELAESVSSYSIDEFLPFDRWPELPARLASLLSSSELPEPA